jgi:hypothetical protein
VKLNAGEIVNDRVAEWLAPPPEAMMITWIVPVVAVDVAAKETVTVHVGLHGLSVKIAVTPAGSVEVENVTAVVVPLTGVASIDDDGLVEPCTTVKLLGDGVDREKSNPGAATVSDNVLK